MDGMNVLNKIEQQPTGERDRPEQPIKVVSCGEISQGKTNGVVENGKHEYHTEFMRIALFVLN